MFLVVRCMKTTTGRVDADADLVVLRHRQAAKLDTNANGEQRTLDAVMGHTLRLTALLGLLQAHASLCSSLLQDVRTKLIAISRIQQLTL
jgi:hypothetical protein